MTAREFSPVGQRLAAALVAGEELDLVPDLPRGELPDEAVMRAWGPEHDLPAEDLVDLLRGLGLPGGQEPHPRSVRVRGARIVGRLTLDFVVTAVPLSAIKARDRCPINPDPTSATATALTVATLVLQFLAWALAALFVAGFTGAVRKT